MERNKLAISARLLGLISAEKILEEESIITSTVRARIKNRIRQLLGENEKEIAEIVMQYVYDFNQIESEEGQNLVVPEMPGEIRRSLSSTELKLVDTLLENFGYSLTTVELVKAVYDEEMDPTIPDCDNLKARKIRTIACAARKKIKGWAVINSKQGRGYWIEIVSEQSP